MNELSVNLFPRDVHSLNDFSANDLDELSINGLNEVYINFFTRDVHGMNELSTNGLNGLSVNIFPCNVYFLNKLFSNVRPRGFSESVDVTS